MTLPQLSGQQASKRCCVPILCDRGNGYALEFGVQHLRLNPADVVVTMDADCRLGENASVRTRRAICRTVQGPAGIRRSRFISCWRRSMRHQEKE